MFEGKKLKTHISRYDSCVCHAFTHFRRSAIRKFFSSMCSYWYWWKSQFIQLPRVEDLPETFIIVEMCRSYLFNRISLKTSILLSQDLPCQLRHEARVTNKSRTYSSGEHQSTAETIMHNGCECVFNLVGSKSFEAYSLFIVHPNDKVLSFLPYNISAISPRSLT